MSEFVEVNTAELTEQALDWATAIATGWVDIGVSQSYPGCRTIKLPGADSHLWVGHRSIYLGVFEVGWFSPTTYWEQGGQLRDKYDVGIEHGVPDGIPYAYLPGRYLDGSRGETALIALCRAIVAAKLGEVVQIPTELAGVHR